jgi:hypothetical protein
MPAVKNVGEPCTGEPQARIDAAAGGNQASRLRRAAQAPPANPTARHSAWEELQQRPPTSMGCSIRDGAVVSPAAATLLLQA